MLYRWDVAVSLVYSKFTKIHIFFHVMTQICEEITDGSETEQKCTELCHFFAFPL